MTHSRRPLLKRVTLWTAGVTLLLASYVLGAPFVAYFGARFAPQIEPVFAVVYAPLVYIYDNPDAPGHAPLSAYLEWCLETLTEKLGEP